MGLRECLVLVAFLVAAAACSRTADRDSLVIVFSTGDKSHLAAVRFLPGGARVATVAGDGVIRVFDRASGEQLRSIATSIAIDSLAVGPEGRVLLAGNEDGTLSLWDPQRPSLTRWRAHAGEVHGVDISPDGRIAASGSDDGTVKLWELPSGAELRTLRGHTSWVGHVRFSPDGSRLLSASADSTLRVWNVATGDVEQVLQGHSTWVRSGVFLAEGSEILSGGYDQTLRLWDARTGETLRTMTGRGMVYEVAGTPDGRWGISVDRNSSLSLWDLATGTRRHRYTTPWQPERNTTSCGDVSTDGNWAAAGDWDGRVYVWDLRPAQAGK